MAELDSSNVVGNLHFEWPGVVYCLEVAVRSGDISRARPVRVELLAKTRGKIQRLIFRRDQEFVHFGDGELKAPGAEQDQGVATGVRPLAGDKPADVALVEPRIPETAACLLCLRRRTRSKYV